MSNSRLNLSDLDLPSKRLLQELKAIDLVLVDPKDPDRRNAAITLACFGLVKLTSFEQSMWELSRVS